MLRKFVLSILAVGLLITLLPCYGLQKAFYTLRDADAPFLLDHFNVMKDIEHHHDQIDILITQAYQIGPQGYVSGEVEPHLQKGAKQYGTKLMAMVTNQAFNQDDVHQFLQDPKAQQRAIKTLVQLCQDNNYYGIQIDFEHMKAEDREAFTHFYQQLARAIHKAGFKISVTIIPLTSNIPATPRLQKLYKDWGGAYDQKRLGQASDFVVLMTYNQHGGVSTPGPTTSYHWAKKVVEYSLQYIPAKKIYLGIPTTSSYWTMQPISKVFVSADMTLNGKQINPDVNQAIDLSFQQAHMLQEMRGFKWQWDNNAKVHYAIFPYHNLYRYVYLEDGQSFDALKQLAEPLHLGGIAVFRLGDEDPAIWQRVF